MHAVCSRLLRNLELGVATVVGDGVGVVDEADDASEDANPASTKTTRALAPRLLSRDQKPNTLPCPGHHPS